MTARELVVSKTQTLVRGRVADAVLGVLVKIPASRETQAVNDAQALARAGSIARSSARKASLLATTMSLPPGPLGWITFLPELVAVWKLQGQMVADIAAVYGKSATLSREHMLYCMFKHVSAQALRDLVVRVGERVLVKKASGALLQTIAQKLGLQLTQKLVGKGVSRFVPVIGAIGVGAYAYFDTTRVAQTATELFTRDVAPESE